MKINNIHSILMLQGIAYLHEVGNPIHGFGDSILTHNIVRLESFPIWDALAAIFQAS
jgi:hypothetical protein